MTTREDEVGARVRRDEPGRTGPIRSQAKAAGADGSAAQDQTVSESIAQSVRLGYDVIAENIRQGREAAARFRQGEYNIRDVPQDAELVLTRFMDLARTLGTTTLEVAETLLKALGTLQPPNGGADMPPFRAPAVHAAAGHGRMALTVEFTGESGAASRALSRTTTLDRPRTPAAPGDLFATPLTSPGAPQMIGEVRFEMRVGIDGVIAVVTLPDGTAAGVYSGLVYVRGDDTPLGLFSVEVGG